MYTEQIERGVEWLNENYPDWVKGINLETLNMVDSKSCILGQLYGYFFDAPEEVLYYKVDFGFNIRTTDMFWCYDDLTTEWKKKIVELKS